jgi:hypothetical protein
MLYAHWVMVAGYGSQEIPPVRIIYIYISVNVYIYIVDGIGCPSTLAAAPKTPSNKQGGRFPRPRGTKVTGDFQRQLDCTAKAKRPQVSTLVSKKRPRSTPTGVSTRESLAHPPLALLSLCAREEIMVVP